METKVAWEIPKNKPNTSKISTRDVVKKHLKEWNMDENELNRRAKEYMTFPPKK